METVSGSRFLAVDSQLSMKVLVTGANGMVARAVVAHCAAVGDEVVARTRDDLDISDGGSVAALMESERFDAVINCAAFTDVDGSESQIDRCYAVNAHGVENLAVASRATGSVLVTISTDYVFDGREEGLYTEESEAEPLGVYGRSKLEGERLAAAANPESVIVRTGWIYGRGGTNFLSMVPTLLAEGKTIKAITDSFGTPTFASDLAVRLRELALLRASGIFNVTNEGEGTSYAGFAEEVCGILGIDRSLLEYAVADDLKRPAPRPRNSRLACSRAAQRGLAPLPEWRDALNRFLR